LGAGKKHGDLLMRKQRGWGVANQRKNQRQTNNFKRQLRQGNKKPSCPGPHQRRVRLGVMVTPAGNGSTCAEDLRVPRLDWGAREGSANRCRSFHCPVLTEKLPRQALHNPVPKRWHLPGRVDRQNREITYTINPKVGEKQKKLSSINNRNFFSILSRDDTRDRFNKIAF
jgi:hypothetical protein